MLDGLGLFVFSEVPQDMSFLLPELGGLFKLHLALKELEIEN